MVQTERETVLDIANQLRSRLGEPPSVFAVLGSGWKEQAHSLIEVESKIDLSSVNNWLVPAVGGHGAELVLGR